MGNHRILAAGVVALASTVTAGTAQASAIFTDTTFAGYTVAFAATPAGTTFASMQCTTCGNPGSGLELTITDSTGAQVGAAVVKAAFTYNPTLQGAISSISASVDKNFFVTAPNSTFGNTFRLVIQQGTSLYTAAVFGPSLGAGGAGVTTTTGYNRLSLTNLGAADFFQYDTATGTIGTAHPDFALPITFGIGQFLAANAFIAGSPVALVSDYDNLVIAVQSVPEPATWAMLVMGFGMVGAGLRARRRTTVRFV